MQKTEKKIINKSTTFTFPHNYYEEAYWRENKLVCGIDEVGRGCLAGPVVAAAALLPANTTYKDLKDSKCMSEKARNTAFSWLKENCLYGIGIVNSKYIDQHNIRNATLLAMHKACMHLLSTLQQPPSAFLVDAMPLSFQNSVYQNIPVYSFIKGEQKSSSIAAASIIAKVWRDDLITHVDQQFPGYHLSQHKGYGTAKHRMALKEKRDSIIHRTTFLKNIL